MLLGICRRSNPVRRNIWMRTTGKAVDRRPGHSSRYVVREAAQMSRAVNSRLLASSRSLVTGVPEYSCVMLIGLAPLFPRWQPPPV